MIKIQINKLGAKQWNVDWYEVILSNYTYDKL